MFKSGCAHNGLRFMILSLTGLFLCFQPVCADEGSITQVVRVIGSANIYKENIARAREQAISNGLDAAVDAVILNMMPLEELVEEFQTTNEIIIDHAASFIEHYKVLAETQYGSVYRVMVEVTVSVADLEQRFSNAGMKLTTAAMPSVLLLISEQNLDAPFPRYWWGGNVPYFKSEAETAISEMMENNGFDVIDPGVMTHTVEIEPDNNRPDLSDQGAMDIGKQFGADLVVVGRSSVEKTENVMGADTRSFNAGITARVLRTESGEEIASTDQSATAVSTNESEGSRDALIKAGSLAGEELAARISETWKKGSAKPAMIRIEVRGTSNLGNFVLFRNVLNDIAGVKRIQIKELMADTSTIMVDYSGSTKSLADSLMIRTYETFSINISEVSEEHLRVELVSK